MEGGTPNMAPGCVYHSAAGRAQNSTAPTLRDRVKTPHAQPPSPCSFCRVQRLQQKPLRIWRQVPAGPVTSAQPSYCSRTLGL